MNNAKIMRILLVTLLFVISLCPLCDAQEKEIYCITLIDQRFLEHLQGECIFGEEDKDTIGIIYNMGHLRFIDANNKLSNCIKSHSLIENESPTISIQLCFDIDRLIGRQHIEKRKYVIQFPLFIIEEFFKYPNELLICEIITLNKKKDKYLFYWRWGSWGSAIKEKKGKKIHWKNFVFTDAFF